MSKAISILKGLGYAYILTLGVILVYNGLLTFTSMSSDSMEMVISLITIFSAAFGGFYACKCIKEKGLLYGFLEGLLYIVFLIVLIFLAKEKFIFEKSLIYNIIFTTLAGGIGGVIGVNFK